MRGAVRAGWMPSHLCPVWGWSPRLSSAAFSVHGLHFLLDMHPRSRLCQTSWNKLPNGLRANFLLSLWILRSIENFPWTTASSFQVCREKVSFPLLGDVSPRVQEQRAVVRPPVLTTPFAMWFREKSTGFGVRLSSTLSFATICNPMQCVLSSLTSGSSHIRQMSDYGGGSVAVIHWDNVYRHLRGTGHTVHVRGRLSPSAWEKRQHLHLPSDFME